MERNNPLQGVIPPIEDKHLRQLRQIVRLQRLVLSYRDGLDWDNLSDIPN